MLTLTLSFRHTGFSSGAPALPRSLRIRSKYPSPPVFRISLLSLSRSSFWAGDLGLASLSGAVDPGSLFFFVVVKG